MSCVFLCELSYNAGGPGQTSCKEAEPQPGFRATTPTQTKLRGSLLSRDFPEMPGLFPGGKRKEKKKSSYSDTGREGSGTVVTEGQWGETARKRLGGVVRNLLMVRNTHR